MQGWFSLPIIDLKSQVFKAYFFVPTLIFFAFLNKVRKNSVICLVICSFRVPLNSKHPSFIINDLHSMCQTFFIKAIDLNFITNLSNKLVMIATRNHSFLLHNLVQLAILLYFNNILGSSSMFFSILNVLN